jgi:probable rRNA maturation factor
MSRFAIDIDVDEERWGALLGCDPAELARTVAAATERHLPAAAPDQRPPGAAVSILFTSDVEMRRLNVHFRGQDKATNVLSFPAAAGFGALGDVALGYETVRAEAETQHKSAHDHAAHLIAHGFLHLLGYDHETDGEAEAMEAIERAVLADLGIANPYE